MLKSDSKNLERGLLIMIGSLAVVVVGVFFWNFFFTNQILSSDIAQWGQFGDYFGGTLNPIIGLVTAYFAYQAYQNTKVSAQQQKFVATVELFMKIYDIKFTGIRYEINPGHELVGEAACERIARELKGRHGVLTGNVLGNHIENMPELDRIVSIAKPFIDAIAVLEKQLTDTHERTKFFEIVAAYSSPNLLQCIQRLGNCQNYRPADGAAFELLQQVARRLARP